MVAGKTQADPSKVAVVKVAHGDFFVLARKPMLDKWRADPAIPLVDVLELYTVLKTGIDRHMHEAPHAELLRYFGTNHLDDVLHIILNGGTEEPAGNQAAHTAAHRVGKAYLRPDSKKSED